MTIHHPCDENSGFTLLTLKMSCSNAAVLIVFSMFYTASLVLLFAGSLYLLTTSSNSARASPDPTSGNHNVKYLREGKEYPSSDRRVNAGLSDITVPHSTLS